MRRVYAVASAKGGVGKTTTTANLGVALAAAGHRVAVVDADLGMPNLARVLGVTPDGPTLHAVLAGEAAPLDAVVEGPHGLGVVPGETDLVAYAKADPRGLRGVLDALVDDDYDFVVVDTGAGLSHDTVLPLGVVDAVLLVSTPSTDALGDTERTRKLADRVGASVAGLVLTRVDTARVDVDALVADLGIDLLEVVPEDPSVEGETADGGPVVARAPDASATAAYRALADALAADAMDTTFDEPPVAAAFDDAADSSDAPDAEEGPATTDSPDAPDASGRADETDETDETDDVDVSSVLDDDSHEELDEVLELDDEGDGADERAVETNAADVGTGDEPTDDESSPDGDSALESKSKSEPEPESESESEPEPESESESAGGLASTLADVESGAEKPTDEPADRSQAGAVSIPDAVAEAEPDAPDGVTFDAAPPPDDADVTIQPDDAPTIPDAESDAQTPASPDDEPVDDEGPDDESDADGSAGESEAEGKEKKGLFGRFFG